MYQRLLETFPGDIVRVKPDTLHPRDRMLAGQTGCVIKCEFSNVLVALERSDVKGTGIIFRGRNCCHWVYDKNLEMVEPFGNRVGYFYKPHPEGSCVICNDSWIVEGVYTPKHRYINGTVVMSAGCNRCGKEPRHKDKEKVRIYARHDKVMFVGVTTQDLISSFGAQQMYNTLKINDNPSPVRRRWEAQ